MEGPRQRAAIAAIEEVLAARGTDVCETEWGKNLGRASMSSGCATPPKRSGRCSGMVPPHTLEAPIQGKGEILLRVYFMTEGRKLVLLLAGYDKGRFGSGKREDRAIAKARQRAAQQKQRTRRAKAKRRRDR